MYLAEQLRTKNHLNVLKKTFLKKLLTQNNESGKINESLEGDEENGL